MDSVTSMRNYRYAALGSVLVASLAVTAGCGGSSGGGGNSSSGGTSTSGGSSNSQALNPATAKAQVTALYTRFFSEPQSKALTDLQDGSSLAKAIKIAARIKGSAKEKAKVKKVTIDTSATPPTATVTYALLSNGTAVLPSATGQAVYVNGKWQVAKTTFCTLVTLGNNNKTPAGC